MEPVSFYLNWEIMPGVSSPLYTKRNPDIPEVANIYVEYLGWLEAFFFFLSFFLPGTE